MANIIDYKNLKIIDQNPSQPAGLMINDNFKIIADDLESKQSQIDNIPIPDLSNYTPLTTTSTISANLQTQINNIEGSDISSYTELVTTAAISAGLQSEIDLEIQNRTNADLNLLSIIAATSGGTVDLNGYTELATTAAISANLQSQILNITGGGGASLAVTFASSANALVQANNYTLTTSESLQNNINSKQDLLIDGVTIKTINGVSILGSGNLSISGTSSSLSPGFDIVLAAGQSNMNGRGTLDTAIDFSNSSVYQFGSYSGNATYYRKIFSGIDPLHMPDGVNTGRIGPAGWFSKAYTRLTGRDVLLVPYAIGGTAVVAGAARWSPTNPGDLYSGAITQANLAIIAAQQYYPNSNFVGTIWFQGESDGDSSVSQSTYASALTQVISGFRSAIVGASNSWFIMAQMVPEAISTHGGYPAIDLAHKQIRDTIPKTALALTNDLLGYTSDNLHFNAAGIRIVGVRLALQVPTAITNNGSQVAPSQVINLASGAITDTSIYISWSAPVSGSATTDYIVEYKASTDSNWIIFNDGTSTTANATVTNLTQSTSYDFRVKALNDFGQGPYSAILTVSTIAGATLNSAVVNLSAGSAGTNTVPLTWGIPLSGTTPTDYLIQYTTNISGAWTTFNDGTSTNTNTTVTGLSASTLYNFSVSPVNIIGTGPSSIISATTASVTSSETFIPSAVINLSAGSGIYTMPLIWGAPLSGNTPTDYIVKYKINSDISWTTFNDGVNTSTTTTVTGLSASTFYNFNVSALNAYGTGTESTISASTQAIIIPGQVTNLSASNFTAGTADLTWGVPSGGPIIDYIIQYTADLSAGNWILFNDSVTSAPSSTVTGLSTGTIYNFKVQAQNQYTTGPFSDNVSGTTTSDSTILYNFETDTLGAAPVGMTKTSIGDDCAMIVSNTGAPSGIVSKYVNMTGTSGSTINFWMDNFPSATNQMITWKRGAKTSDAARDGFTLRAGGGYSVGAGYSNMSRGYNFQASDANASMRIYKFDASTQTLIGSAFTFNIPTFCWFRASCIGTNVKFEYSLNGSTWVTAVNQTDSSFTSGGVEYVNGFGIAAAARNSVAIDDITYQIL
jgi:hypothetical protein